MSPAPTWVCLPVLSVNRPLPDVNVFVVGVFVFADGCARRQGQPADFPERVLGAGLVAVEGEATEQRAFASGCVFAVPLRQIGFFVHLDAAVSRFGLFCGVDADARAEQKGDGQCGK